MAPDFSSDLLLKHVGLVLYLGSVFSLWQIFSPHSCTVYLYGRVGLNYSLYCNAPGLLISTLQHSLGIDIKYKHIEVFFLSSNLTYDKPILKGFTWFSEQKSTSLSICFTEATNSGGGTQERHIVKRQKALPAGNSRPPCSIQLYILLSQRSSFQNAQC